MNRRESGDWRRCLCFAAFCQGISLRCCKNSRPWGFIQMVMSSRITFLGKTFSDEFLLWNSLPFSLRCFPGLNNSRNLYCWVDAKNSRGTRDLSLWSMQYVQPGVTKRSCSDFRKKTYCIMILPFQKDLSVSLFSVLPAFMFFVVHSPGLNGSIYHWLGQWIWRCHNCPLKRGWQEHENELVPPGCFVIRWRSKGMERRQVKWQGWISQGR